jgi:hypothetical protein
VIQSNPQRNALKYVKHNWQTEKHSDAGTLIYGTMPRKSCKNIQQSIKALLKEL